MTDAFHLPALPDVPVSARGAFRFAELTPAEVVRQMEALRTARDRFLTDRPIAEIVDIVDRVAQRFQQPTDPLRCAAEAALPEATGLSLPMVRHVLDRMAADWRMERSWALLRAEFGDPEVLDGFRRRPGERRATRAWGPRCTFQIWSGNVPGVAVTALVRTLLVKSATFGKAAAAEPLLTALFARGIAELDPDLGTCIAVAHWPGTEESLTHAALDRADAVVVYGTTHTFEAVRVRTPARARFLGYGHRLSFGIVGREAVNEDSAARAAEDVVAFDQQGCVSPHLFYVEAGGALEPSEWAGLLAAGMGRLESELPRGTIAATEAAAIHQLRGAAEFAPGVELHTQAEGTAWTVVWDPDPTFEASCLNRTVRVKPVADLDAVPGLVREIAPLLQTVGIAAAPERRRRLAGMLGSAGASRVVPIGKMAWPPPEWHHDGRPPLADLVHWCDLEEE